jgi:hypothetical protein
MILTHKPKVPSEYEGYYQLVLKMITYAKHDIKYARVGGWRFESAVAWLLYGDGYKFARTILSEPHNIRKVYEPIVDQRRRDSESKCD